MAKVNLIQFDGNKKKNKLNSTAGKLSFTLAGGLGTMASGSTYKVASVPANSLILSVDLVVTEAFNGTTPTVDVEVGGAVVHNDIAVSALGVNSSEVRVHVTSLTDIEVTPTLTGATAGALEVVVTYVELNGYDGAFTE